MSTVRSSRPRPIRARDWVIGFALLLAVVIAGAAFWYAVGWLVMHVV